MVTRASTKNAPVGGGILGNPKLPLAVGIMAAEPSALRGQLPGIIGEQSGTLRVRNDQPVTTTVPFIRGWTTQWYPYVPGALKVCRNSPALMIGEENE